ncbi:MAG: glycosyltransferase family A protein [bacterium]|nr:glycosyltransferase family A protein [bacterium]
MKPLVSILLPVWNAATTLAACLRSIQRQTTSCWQCIIVDDGSDDGSLACAHRFAAADARFVVVSIPHRGVVTALNTGLDYCHGPLIARMDADDLMHRKRLAVQVQALNNTPQLVAIGCHVRLFPRRHLRQGRLAYERWLGSIDSAQRVCQDAFVECPIAHPTLMIRRQVLLALGYRDRGWPEDYDLILRLLSQGSAVGVVPRRLLSWRDHPQRLSRVDPRYALASFTACKAAFLAAHFLADSETYILWGYGSTGKALRRALLPYAKRPSYIVELHPGRLGKRIHHALVIAPEALTQTPRHPVVVSVAGLQARTEIRQSMAAMGFVEGRDFVCAA